MSDVEYLIGKPSEYLPMDVGFRHQNAGSVTTQIWWDDRSFSTISRAFIASAAGMEENFGIQIHPQQVSAAVAQACLHYGVKLPALVIAPQAQLRAVAA